jgi:hypothetical protein
MNSRQVLKLVETTARMVGMPNDEPIHWGALDCAYDEIHCLSTLHQLEFIQYVLTNDRFVYEEAREILECMAERMFSEFDTVVETMAAHCLALIVADHIQGAEQCY